MMLGVESMGVASGFAPSLPAMAHTVSSPWLDHLDLRATWGGVPASEEHPCLQDVRKEVIFQTFQTATPGQT